MIKNILAIGLLIMKSSAENEVTKCLQPHESNIKLEKSDWDGYWIFTKLDSQRIWSLKRILMGIRGAFIVMYSVVEMLTGDTIVEDIEVATVTFPVKNGNPMILLPIVTGFVLDKIFK